MNVGKYYTQHNKEDVKNLLYEYFESDVKLNKLKDKIADYLLHVNVDDKKLKEKYAVKARNIHFCNTYMEYVEDTEGKLHCRYVNRCRERICPVCAKTRSMTYAKRLKCVIDKIKYDDELTDTQHCYTFWTLSPYENQPISKLRDILKLFNKKFKHIIQNGCFGDVAGYWISVEVTKNKKTNTYHPHMHILMCYEAEKWQWVDRIKLSERLKGYFPECSDSVMDWVRGFPNHDNVNVKSILEVTKYICDFTKIKDAQTCVEIMEATHGVQMSRGSGILRWHPEYEELLQTPQNCYCVSRIIYVHYTPKHIFVSIPCAWQTLIQTEIDEYIDTGQVSYGEIELKHLDAFINHHDDDTTFEFDYNLFD